MIEDIPVINNDDKKKRNIMIAVIIIICALSIIITMIIQIKQLEEPEQPVVEENNNEVEVVDFSEIFNNTVNYQGQTINVANKSNIDLDLVYSTYTKKEKEENKYEMDVNIPEININNTEIKRINKEIKDTFMDKAEKILSSAETENVVYTVEYSACINSNILSLVIKSTLKEENNAQRVIVKGYTYNTSTGTSVTLNDLIAIKQLDKSKMKTAIDKAIYASAIQSQGLINLGYSVYERNLDDSMYEIDNIDNFYYGENGVIYIIFAYGNNYYTSELDVIPIT